MDAAVAALLGAAIGALGSVGGAWIQQRHQTRRERLKMAADLGLADHNNDFARIQKGGGAIPPLSAYVMYHSEILDALAKGPLTPDLIKDIDKRQRALMKAFPGAEGEKT